jgi:predicted methyltransferase
VLEADGIDCLPGPFEDSAALTQQIPDIVREFMAGLSPETLVLDLTPGNKWMTWIADRAMPEGSWRLYVRNDTLTPTDGRPRPGSEQLVCWRV